MLAFRKEESFNFSSQTNEELSISITFRYLTHGILIPSTLNIFAWEDYKKKKIPLEAMSRNIQDKEVIWHSQHSFPSRKSCLTNLADFCDGETASVDRRKQLMPSTWTSVRTLTWSHITLLTPNLRYMDLKGGIFSGVEVLPFYTV